MLMSFLDKIKSSSHQIAFRLIITFFVSSIYSIIFSRSGPANRISAHPLRTAEKKL